MKPIEELINDEVLDGHEFTVIKTTKVFYGKRIKVFGLTAEFDMDQASTAKVERQSVQAVNDGIDAFEKKAPIG